MGTQLGASTIIGRTMSLSVALLSLILASAAAAPAPRVGECGVADEYIDEVLVNVAKTIIESGMDPADLPGDEIGFSMDIGFITVHGSARYDQGHLNGLSTIQRTGDTELCNGEDDTLDLRANIGVRELTAGYHLQQSSRASRLGRVLRLKSTVLIS